LKREFKVRSSDLKTLLQHRAAEGNRLIAISHFGEQHGDLMRDPEMVFEMHTSAAPDRAEPLSFRNDYMSLMQEVYRYDDSGKKTHVNARLSRSSHPSLGHGSPTSRSETVIRERLT
jgi:hypothetical protein